MRDRLIGLISEAGDKILSAPCVSESGAAAIADYLLANGVIVLDSAAVDNRNRSLASEYFGKPLNEVIELIKAEKEGRIIVPPCKVGDKVYKISRNKVKECEVVFVGISAEEKCSHFNFVENYSDGKFYKSYSMVFDVISKTVFLTREAAEKALKERSRGMSCKHKKKLTDNNFCKAACAYCTYEQESSCTKKHKQTLTE